MKSPVASRASAGRSEPGVTSTRKPRLPWFTPSTGTGRSTTSRIAPSIVPSPPSATMPCTPVMNSASGTAFTSAGTRPRSSARASRVMSCWRDQSVIVAIESSTGFVGCSTSPIALTCGP